MFTVYFLSYRAGSGHYTAFAINDGRKKCYFTLPVSMALNLCEHVFKINMLWIILSPVLSLT